MPARTPATQAQRDKYRTLRLEGWTQAQAAEIVGLSHAWGKKMDAQMSLRAEIKEAKYHNPDADIRPLHKSELSKIALDCLEDFGRFRGRQFGRISSPWQEEAANIVRTHLETPYKEFGVVNAPPGSGKSTLFTHDIPAWLTARSRTLRGFIGSSTQAMAANYTFRLRNTLARTIPMQAKSEDLRLGLAMDAESTLARDYGIFRPDPTLGAPWNRNFFTVAQFGEISVDEKESTWAAFGKDTGFLGYRVHIIVWDDLFRREDMLGINKAEKLEKFYMWYDDEAETRLEPGGLLLLQGQRLGADDIYAYCKEKRTYAEDDEDLALFELGEEQEPTERKYFHVVFKAHYDELCDAAIDPYVHSRKSKPYDPHNPQNTTGHAPCLLDPARLPWRELRSKMNQPMGNYKVVYQQEDVDPADALVPRFFIDGGTYEGQDYDGCWDNDRGPGELPDFLTKHISGERRLPRNTIIKPIITADPSPSKFWSVQWWIYVQLPNQERLMGNRYLINQVFTPMGANDLLDYDTNEGQWEGLLVDWASQAKALKLPIEYFILEVNAAQKFMKQYKFFKQWMKDNRIKLKSHHTHINKLDSKLGVTTIRSQYEYGRVRLPGNRDGRYVAEPLYKQVTQYPDAMYDDCVMAHWFLEYQLQYIVKKHKNTGTLNMDMPSWLKREPSYA